MAGVPPLPTVHPLDRDYMNDATIQPSGVSKRIDNLKHSFSNDDDNSNPKLLKATSNLSSAILATFVSWALANHQVPHDRKVVYRLLKQVKKVSVKLSTCFLNKYIF